RLQDQPLGEQQLVVGTQACRGTPGWSDVGGGLDLEPVRRQTLHAEGRPLPLRAGAEIMAHAQLRAPERGDGVVPQRLELAIFEPAAAAFALAAQPQLVRVTSV